MVLYDVCLFACQVCLDEQDQLLWLGVYLKSSDIK